MGEIVAAVGTCHTPYMFTRPPDENPEQLDQAARAMKELGHAFSIPFEYVIGKRNIPVIPFFTNVYVPPLPTPKRCEALGKALAQIVKGRKEKVAIIASGGMSHFPGTTKYLHPEFDFDRWLLSQFEAGNINALLNMSGTQLDEVGNTEMLSWAVMFGAIGAPKGELIDYIPTWHHGLGMMRFLPHREVTHKMDAAAKPGWTFKDECFL